MSLHISMEAQVQDATRYLTDAMKKQVPFATARALTALAFEIQKAEGQGIAETFKHPRPFTKRGVLVNKATKSSLLATVFLRQEVANYIGPFEFGGPQFMPGKGVVFVTPKNIALDQYGQLRGRPRALGEGPDTFVGTVRFKRSGETVSGFWRRPPRGERRDGTKGTVGNTQGTVGGVRTGLTLIARFDRSPHMASKSLGFAERAMAVAMARSRQVFDRELEKALASAK